MKKITTAFVLLGLTTVSAMAAPSYIQRDGRYGYNVTYNYLDKAKSGWYVAGRGELSFLNWKNKYEMDGIDHIDDSDSDADSDSYSFEPVFGGSVSFGKKIQYLWRVEGEAGYIGYFQDKDNGFEFDLSAPYLMVNGYRDFSNGLYIGAGAGAALVMTSLDNEDFIAGDRRKTTVSPMGGIMLGYTHKLDDNFVLDLRYRLAGFMGSKQTRTFNEYDDTIGDIVGQHDFENKIDFVMDNSISIGLRYEF